MSRLTFDEDEFDGSKEIYDQTKTICNTSLTNMKLYARENSAEDSSLKYDKVIFRQCLITT